MVDSVKAIDAWLANLLKGNTAQNENSPKQCEFLDNFGILM